MFLNEKTCKKFKILRVNRLRKLQKQEIFAIFNRISIKVCIFVNKVNCNLFPISTEIREFNKAYKTERG